MKLIFLDIDGVLNNQTTISSGIHLCNQRVSMLHDFVQEADAHVVISSSWRSLFQLDTIKDMLWSAGFQERDRIVGVTPNSGFGFACRGEEIESVLVANKDIEAYAILDDDQDMTVDQQPFFVKTCFQKGLQIEHISKLRSILL